MPVLRVIRSFLLVLVVAWGFARPAVAAELLGADAVIRRVVDKTGATIARQVRVAADADRPSATRAVPLSVAEWSARLGRFIADKVDDADHVDSAERWFADLPEPGAQLSNWRALRTAVHAIAAPEEHSRQALALHLWKLITAALVEDAAAVRSLALTLPAPPADEHADADSGALSNEAFAAVLDACARWLPNAADRLAILDRQLDIVEKSQSDMHITALTGLVEQVGEQLASPRIERALLLDHAVVQSWSGEQTLRVAASLAAKHSKDLPRPTWALCTPAHVAKLMPILTERFGDEQPDESHDRPLLWRQREDWLTAHAAWFCHLVKAKRSDEAAKVLDTLLAVANDEFYLPDFPERDEAAIAAIVHAKLREDPTRPLWFLLRESSQRSGTMQRAVELAMHVAKEKSCTNKIVADLLLADSASAAIAAGATLMHYLGMQAPAEDDAHNAVKFEWSTAVHLAHLMGDQQRIEELVQLLSKQPEEIPVDLQSLEALIDIGRSEIAEQLIVRYFEHAGENVMPEGMRARLHHAQSRAMLEPYLAMLINVYHRSGRPRDVLAVVERLPLWQDADAAHLNPSAFAYGFPWATVAHALHAVGRDGEAIRLLTAGLWSHPDNIVAWATLADLAGKNTQARDALSTLASAYPTSELAQGWLARAHLAGGRFAEAASAAARAQELIPDPYSYTHANRYWRMAGDDALNNPPHLDVLAALAEREGRADHAARLRRTTEAVQRLREAHVLSAHGLLARALGIATTVRQMDPEASTPSLTVAHLLADMGRVSETREVYEHAFSRMPACTALLSHKDAMFPGTSDVIPIARQIWSAQARSSTASAATWFRLSQCYQSYEPTLQNHDEQWRCVEQALRRDPRARAVGTTMLELSRVRPIDAATLRAAWAAHLGQERNHRELLGDSLYLFDGGNSNFLCHAGDIWPLLDALRQRDAQTPRMPAALLRLAQREMGDGEQEHDDIPTPDDQEPTTAQLLGQLAPFAPLVNALSGLHP